MRKLLTKPRAVAGLTVALIDEDTRVFEHAGGKFHLHLVEPEQTRRLQTQEFITQAYRRVFQAELRTFYPSMIALHDTDESLQGAAGARYADGQVLFLEQYLPLPVERLISGKSNQTIQRSHIVELGNLCVVRPAMTYPFISMIGGWLQTYEVDWIVFALTHSLRKLFLRAGVELLDLGAAEPKHLKPSPNRWGNYYAHDPRVMAARLATNLTTFQQHHRQRKFLAAGPKYSEAVECRI